MNIFINLYKRSLSSFLLLVALFGMPNTLMATSALRMLTSEVQGSTEPYMSGGEGITGTSDGGAIVTDTLNGRVVKIDSPSELASSGPWGDRGRILAGGGQSNEDDIPARDAILYYPKAVAEHNGSILVVTRIGRDGDESGLIREIYPKDGTYYIRTIAGGGSSAGDEPTFATNIAFGEIHTILSISKSDLLVVNNNYVWRLTRYPTSPVWMARKIVGEGLSGAVFDWASGIDVTRTADGGYQDLLLGAVLTDGTRTILRFTGDWISGKGHMTRASKPLSKNVLALVALRDGTIAFSTYDHIQLIKNGQTDPITIFGDGNYPPTYRPYEVFPSYTLKLGKVTNMAHLGKIAEDSDPGSFLIADCAYSFFYRYIPYHP